MTKTAKKSIWTTQMEPIQINQIDLICAISKHLERSEKIKEVEPRHYNAIIQAANAIVEAFARPFRSAAPCSGLQSWLDSDDVGASSKYMAMQLSGRVGTECSHPLDVDDFGRCVRMLEVCPELRPLVPLMVNCSPEWAALVERWDELTQLYTQEKFAEAGEIISKLAR